MARETKIKGYHIEVYPKTRIYGFAYNEGSDDQRRTCNSIMEQIKRHVDDTHGVYLIDDKDEVCGFCGSRWTEGNDSPHNGGCCDEDCKLLPEEAAV